MAEYIEREAVNQIIAAQCGECADFCLEFDGILPDCNQCLLYGAKKAVESIPAADVAPVRHGRWTGHDIGNGRPSIDEDTCSLCGSRFYQIAETGCNWHYCPNCGAMMEES